MFRRVHRRLQILVLDVDGVAGLRLFVLGGLEGSDIRIEQFFEFLGAYWLVNWGGLGKVSEWAVRPLKKTGLSGFPSNPLFPFAKRRQ